MSNRQIKDRIPVKFGPGLPMIDKKSSRLLQICGNMDLPTMVMMKLNEQGFRGPGEITVTIYEDYSFDISHGSTEGGAVEFCDIYGNSNRNRPLAKKEEGFSEALLQSGKFGFGSNEPVKKKKERRFLPFLKGLVRALGEG